MGYYKDKRVLITGHTGFKGAWMSEVLLHMGASVAGYSLRPPTHPNLFDALRLDERMDSYIGDIRDLKKLKSVFHRVNPQIVIHMAAQPIVRESYRDPVYTYDVNVMGTVNVLECIRTVGGVKSFVNVTTDKVYRNREWEWGYRENEELNGYDPYSNSKSCAELVTDSYRNSFFGQSECAVTTMRAGNVIGGGDFSTDRIVPDCFRAAQEGKEIIVRNPRSVRPYQHVLEPIMAYLMVAQAQYQNKELAGAYNVGPDDRDAAYTKDVVELFCQIWNQKGHTYVKRKDQFHEGPHEANYLKLDCSKLKTAFGWAPIWDLRQAVERTVDVYERFYLENDIGEIVRKQIEEYLQLASFMKG